jgi:hypothetical protein
VVLSAAPAVDPAVRAAATAAAAAAKTAKTAKKAAAKAVAKAAKAAREAFFAEGQAKSESGPCKKCNAPSVGGNYGFCPSCRAVGSAHSERGKQNAPGKPQAAKRQSEAVQAMAPAGGAAAAVWPTRRAPKEHAQRKSARVG